ncbi:MAG: sigma-70 family RNA polymerase sigma factor [Eubacteriales bacterium]|nr:sigma-70 family RNA polymerase sigma factor [Eubacteriales bacterium]
MTQDERLLIEQAKNGDGDAFTQLYLAQAPRIYALCLRMCGNDADAQDAVQEAMLKAWRHLGRFRGQSSFGTWLYRIALNACRDMLRRRKAPPASLEWMQEKGRQISQPGFEQRSVERQTLQAALGRLSHGHRAIVVLREIEGLSYDEIAQTLRLPVGTVRSRLNRARAQLRQSYQAEGTIGSEDTSNGQGRTQR